MPQYSMTSTPYGPFYTFDRMDVRPATAVGVSLTPQSIEDTTSK